MCKGLYTKCATQNFNCGTWPAVRSAWGKEDCLRHDGLATDSLRSTVDHYNLEAPLKSLKYSALPASNLDVTFATSYLSFAGCCCLSMGAQAV